MPAEEGADELENDYDEQSREWNERNWKDKISQSTRLEAGAFDWLVRWCKSNLTRIEQQRNIPRERSRPEVRKLQQDLRETEDELARRNEQVSRVRKRKRHINRKIVVLTDDERIDSSLSVRKKVFLFYKVMGYPQYDFWRVSNEFVDNERQLVRIYHKMMSAMRVLHHDLVEVPKEQDKKFKARQPSPVKWPILRPAMGPVCMDSDPLEENYVSNAKEARMACKALQELLHSWQQGYLDG